MSAGRPGGWAGGWARMHVCMQAFAEAEMLFAAHKGPFSMLGAADIFVLFLFS